MSPEQVRLRKFEESLTPSADTKAAYSGEYSFTIPACDAGGRPMHDRTPRTCVVPWTVIKEIMADILKRARTP